MIHLNKTIIYLTPIELKELIKEKLVDQNLVSPSLSLDDINIGGQFLSMLELGVTIEHTEKENY